MARSQHGALHDEHVSAGLLRDVGTLLGPRRHAGDRARHARDLVESIGAARVPPDADLKARLLPRKNLSGCDRALLQGVFTPMRRGCHELYGMPSPHILVLPCIARSSTCAESPTTMCGGCALEGSGTRTSCFTAHRSRSTASGFPSGRASRRIGSTSLRTSAPCSRFRAWTVSCR